MRRFADIFAISRIDATADDYAGTTLRLYTGNVNPTKGSAPTGTLTALINLPAPSHNAAARSGSFIQATKAGAWQTESALASGDPGCYTISDGTTILEDGTAGGAGSGADLVLSTANVVAGAPVSVTSHTIREAA